MKKYNIIYADPPWRYQDKAMQRGGAERHYRTMSVDQLCSLNVMSIVADDAILFLWATWPKVFEIAPIFKAWGFEYKTCGFVWIKTNKRTNVHQGSFWPIDSFDSSWGMGRWTRANTEFCLIGTRGKPKRKDAGVHQLIYSPVTQHSKKPDEIKGKIIKLVGDLPRIEMFARKKSNGWDVWGNEVESNESITKYIKIKGAI